MADVAVLHSVTKEFAYKSQRSLILQNVTARIPARARIALLGKRGSGKTAVLRLLSGIEPPTDGHIERFGSVSFILTAIQPGQNFTVKQYIGFISRVYGVDVASFLDFVADVGGLKPIFDHRVGMLAQDVRIQLNCLIFYGIKFDLYLLDGHPVPGTPGFRKRCMPLFHKRAEDSGFILASSSSRRALEFCSSAIVLDGGRFQFFDDIRTATQYFDEVVLGKAGSQPAAGGNAGRLQVPISSMGIAGQANEKAEASARLRERADHYRGLVSKGKSLVIASRYEEAIPILEAACLHSAQNSQAKFYLARALCCVQREEDGIVVLRELIEAEPTFTQARVDLIKLLLTRNPDQARQLIMDAQSMNPSDARLAYLLKAIESANPVTSDQRSE